jgi:tRNA-specific 2-thiouridylase
VCFADRGYTEELRNALGSAIDVPGPLVDTGGNRLGTHRGYMHYTIGQRRGLGLGNGPWYVRRIDPEGNVVVVCRKHELGSSGLVVEDVRWMGPQPPTRLACTVQLRYQSAEIPCVVEPTGDGGAVVRLERPAAITPGQAAVFYEGQFVRGSGTIARELAGAATAPG